LESRYYSVVIPTFNRANSLEKAVKSVLNQTYPYFELIISDDASTDSTTELIKSFSDNRVRYLRMPQNKGNAAARNAGVDIASHEFVCFLDSDDQYECGYLEAVNELVCNLPATTGFMWTGITIVNEKNQPIRSEVWKPLVYPDPSLTFFHELRVGTNCGFVVRRKVFYEVGKFDDRLRAAVDTDFILRISKLSSYAVIEKCLVRFQYSPTSMSVRKDIKRQSEAYQYILSKHDSVWKSNPLIRRKWHYKTARLCYQAGRKKTARNYLYKAGFHPKTFLLFGLYELLPMTWARKLHFLVAAGRHQNNAKKIFDSCVTQLL
jgi:glycosyltransferase involved in cell wall biosynthesis